jgi:hypothetical protein
MGERLVEAWLMLVLVLEGVKRYAVPLRLDRSVTMAGQYITRLPRKEKRSRRCSQD